MEQGTDGGWFPLGRLQIGHWLEYARAPESSAFNRGTTLRIAAPVDLDRLQAAWDEVIARHETLRMVVRAEGGSATQRALTPPRPSWAVTDARGLDEPALRAAAQKEIETPFDLRQGPPARARVFVRDEEIVLVISHAHIHADIAVLDTMLHEIGQLYAAKATGAAVDLPPPGPSYAEFVRWHEERLSGPSLDELEGYWRAQLADAPKALALPTDHPRTLGAPLRRGTHAFKLLDARGVAALEELVRRTGSSRYRVLSAAWIALLHRYTTQEDILFGMLTDARDRGFERSMGSFTNVVPVRVRPRADLPFAELAREIAATVKGAIAHRHYPFALAVERLLPPGERGTSPFFQTLFALGRLFREPTLSPIFLTSQPIPWKADLGGLQIRGSLPVHPHFSTLELELFVVDVHGELAAEIGYDANLFEPDTVRRCATHLTTLLAGALAAPETPLGALPLLERDELETVTVRWNATATPFSDTTMDRLVERHAQERPDAVAMEHGDRRVTYGELDARAHRLARVLRARGVADEKTCVGILLERSVDVPTSFLAVWKAGGFYVPIDVTYPPDRVRLMIDDAAPKVVVVNAATRDLAPPGVARIDLDADRAAIDAESAEPLDKTTTSRSLAYMIYTSGSTGTPKGVLIEHRGVANYVEDVARRWGLSREARAMGFASFSFDSSVADFGGTLAAGGTLVLRPVDLVGGVELERFIVASRITHCQMPPAVWATLPDSATLPLVRTAVMSGDAVTAELVDRWSRDRTLLNEYGPTEITVCATSFTCSPGRAPLIGKPIANVMTFIVDGDGRPVPIGVPGELRLAGVGLARGYWNRPELTAERFVASDLAPGGKVYRTGDRARWLASGDLEFLGRFDDQVKIRGFRVELGEIENAMAEVAGVDAAVVVVRETAERAKHLVGYFTRDAGGAEATADTVRAALRRRLPPYMVPAYLVALEKLPLTPNGKVDRRGLPEPAEEAPATAPAAGAAAAVSVEDAVLAAMRRLLGAPNLTRDDNFFESGGDSLLAIELATDLSEIAGAEVGVLTIFEAPTAGELGTKLSAPEERPSALVEVRPGEGDRLLFLPHAAGGEVVAYFALARRIDPSWTVLALRSPAVEEPEREAGTVAEMAKGYADVVEARQPQGEVYLAGWSAGGLIAWAIAHELESRGRRVAFLGMVDSHLLLEGSPLEKNAFAAVAAELGDLASRLSRLGEAKLQAIGEELVALPKERRFDAAVAVARREGVLGPDEQAVVDPKAVQLHAHHLRLFGRYRPAPLHADVHFWRAEESPAGASAPWAAKTSGRVVEAVLPGNHYSVLIGEGAGPTGQALSLALRKIRP